MLDSFLNSVKRAGEQVQRRGEEVAQVARLRMEIFGLHRELDGAYARLGRAYHAGSDVDLLQGVREDISRVEGEIAARERLIAELDGNGREKAGDAAEGEPQGSVTLVKVDAPVIRSVSEPSAVLPQNPAEGNRPDFNDRIGGR